MTVDLKDARDRVLVDNTAQAVFKHLDRIEDHRAELGPRWIWELIQNARDSARPRGVRIRIRVSASEFSFEHDGKPFASDEIAHLVYHGSTKVEDFQNVGQFGSGFLSTHLLSRTVRVAGRLEDARRFQFSLSRVGDSPEELRVAMDRSWRAFEASVEGALPMSESSTSFVYAVSGQGGTLVERGLENLRLCCPLVLAFCPTIRGIDVEVPGGRWSMRRGDWEPRTGGGILSIEYTEDDEELCRFVAVADGGSECCAAVQLCRSETGLRVDSGQDAVAKLFLLFPLIGTERLGLPSSVNSERFKPHEDRDGIVLSGDSEGAQGNWRLLEDSVQCQAQVLKWCAEGRWGGMERMLAFDTRYLPDWADGDPRFRQFLMKLVVGARSTPLFRTLGGDWIEPRAAWLPATEDTMHGERLWSLMCSWSGAHERLPRREELASWVSNLSSWARLLSTSRPQMKEALTLIKVAEYVNDAGSLKELRGRLRGIESLAWLCSLLELVRDAGEMNLFDEFDLLPNQAGELERRSDLRRDEQISDELKDVAEAFGLEIRKELLDKHAEIEGIVGLLVPEREPELLDRLLGRVRDACREDRIDPVLVPWAVRLFRWIVDRPEYADRLEGLPVPTADDDDDGVAVLNLERALEAPKRPLAPVAVWPETARKFGWLFPRRRILADAFVGDDRDVWRRFEENGYIVASPLVETKRIVEMFLPDEPLPERDRAGAHKSTEEVEISDVACLLQADIGLIDTARKSRKRSTELIRFLVEFVAEADQRAFDEHSVDCECGDQHSFYRAAWLVPLHGRRWVPLDASGRRAAPASAESLAGLLVDSPETGELLSGERGGELLDALGISRADLALRVVAEDEDERLTLIRSMQDLTTAVGDVDRVRELATEIREHPEIIESIEARRSRRRKIQRNQEICRLVEQLLRDALEGCGLTVHRTHIGSDFEVESDFVENEEEMGLELVDAGGSTLIEVKSTRVDEVKMTPVQAETACSFGDGFALCVVPLDDDEPTSETIRQRIRVVFGIGMNLESALKDYRSVREAAETARRPHGAVELVIEEGEVRFRIGHAIWEGALTFGQAVERFKQGG